MKRMIKILLIITAVLVIIFFAALIHLRNDTMFVINFLKQNPKRSSLYFIQNDSVLIATGEKKLMPLASTVKIIIAFEYVSQVNQGKLDKYEMIDLKELERYFIKNTDGGAHTAWIKSINNSGKVTSVSLDQVAEGMIKFSSNANSEYLMERLGLDQINTSIKDAGITSHSPVHPFVSSLLLCSTIKNDSSISEMPEEEYLSKSLLVHDSLKYLKQDELPVTISTVPLSVQKAWSDKLPASTTEVYATLMNKINKGTVGDSSSINHLKKILKPISSSFNNDTLITSYGAKGGSTASVLTWASFLSDNTGNSFSMALFFNNLEDWEAIILRWNLKRFEKKIYLDPGFRKKIIEALSN
jgi:D-alanyl-D-alanine carboxypeptidase